MEQAEFDKSCDENNTMLIANHMKEILKLVGENVDREGLLKTPSRFAQAFQFFTSGMNYSEQHIEDLLRSAIFTQEYDEMVLVKDIEFYSLCEHHLLPFFGKVHVAYIPNGKVVGLSKIPRIVDVFARRLQVQEQLTMQIRDAIQTYLAPKGVAVLIQAYHMCMMTRGVQKQNSTTVTSALSGDFLHDLKTREEFMHLVKNNHAFS